VFRGCVGDSGLGHGLDIPFAIQKIGIAFVAVDSWLLWLEMKASINKRDNKVRFFCPLVVLFALSAMSIGCSKTEDKKVPPMTPETKAANEKAHEEAKARAAKPATSDAAPK